MLRSIPEVQIQDSVLAIDSIITQSPDSLVTALRNQDWIPWDTLLGIGVELLIALGAIITAIYAILSYNKNRKSRRAHLLPAEDAGYVRIDQSNLLDRGNHVFFFNFKNYGINPAYEVKLELLGLNKTGGGIIRAVFNSFNPVASQSSWRIDISGRTLEQAGFGNIQILLINYAIMIIEYLDRNLNERFQCKFYWEIGDDGKLNDPSIKAFNEMNKLEKEESGRIEIDLPRIEYPIEN